MRNHTVITTFILVGLTEDPELQVLIFIFLFLTYVLSVTGNLTIIILTLTDSYLKTPMYFFLRNFSFLEISFTTVCIPRLLYSISSGDNIMTYNACAKYFLLDSLEPPSFFSWLPCPMTPMWPSADPCIT